jgi:hypothetical protein
MADTNDQSGDNNDDISTDTLVVLEAVAFPADRDDLVRAARDSDVDSELMVIIEDLPDEQYETRDDAEKAINDRRDARRGTS